MLTDAASRVLRLSAAFAACVFAAALVGCATLQNAQDEASNKVDAETGKAEDAANGAQVDAQEHADKADAVAADPTGVGQDMAVDELDKHAPGASKDLGLKKRSLCDRAGGKAAMDAVAADMVDMLSASPALKANPKISEGLAQDPAHTKQVFGEYLCRVAGGPCLYSGKPVKDLATGMKVTEGEWKAMGALFIKALRKNNVPKAERVELANLIAANKPLVVGQ